MSELTRARDTPSADSLDSLERAQWDDITKGVETLKVDDDTKPPPTESESIDSIGVKITLTKEQLLRGKLMKEKQNVKALTKEHEDLKREFEEMKKSLPSPPASLKRSASNGRSSYWAAQDGEVVLFYLDDDDDDEEEKIEKKLGYMPDEWGMLSGFTDLRANEKEGKSNDYKSNDYKSNDYKSNDLYVFRDCGSQVTSRTR